MCLSLSSTEETCQPHKEFRVQSHKYFHSVAQANSASKANEILLSRATQVHVCRNCDPWFLFLSPAISFKYKTCMVSRQVQLKFSNMIPRETQAEHSDHLLSTDLFADTIKLVKFPCTQYSYLNNN